MLVLLSKFSLVISISLALFSPFMLRNRVRHAYSSLGRSSSRTWRVDRFLELLFTLLG